MSKIIQFPDSRVKCLFIHITLPMLKGLIGACHKEQLDMPFNKADLEGAFSPLYKNGLIAVKKSNQDGKNKNLWYVTYLGKKALRTSGIKNVS